MTDTEFIEALKEACSYINLNRDIEIQELAQAEQFANFLQKETELTGMTQTDEDYLYCDNQLLSALGSRLSWFDVLSDEPPVELEDTHFPFQGQRFIYNNKTYWLLTMWGQGSMSWIETDELFQANQRIKE